MIRLTQVQKDTLTALYKVVGAVPDMATATDNVLHERLKLRTVPADKDAAGLLRTTKAALESLKAITPRLVDSSGHLWKLTLAGQTIVSVQLRTDKQVQAQVGETRGTGKKTTKSAGDRPRRNNPAR